MSTKKNKFWHNLLEVHEHLCKGCFWIGAFLLFFMAFATSYEVVMRYFFNRPTSWVVDFAEYFLIYSTFLAAAWILKLDAHVKVTFLNEKLGNKARIKLDIFNSLIGAVVCAILSWQGSLDTIDLYVKKVIIVRPIIVPKWLIVGIIPVGLFLFCTYFFRDTISLVSQLRSKSSAME